jgi:hypothetical protein
MKRNIQEGTMQCRVQVQHPSIWNCESEPDPATARYGTTTFCSLQPVSTASLSARSTALWWTPSLEIDVRWLACFVTSPELPSSDQER